MVTLVSFESTRNQALSLFLLPRRLKNAVKKAVADGPFGSLKFM